MTTPGRYWTTTNPKTAVQAIKSNCVTVGAIKKQNNGPVVVKAFLSVIVTELVKSFNVGKTMDDMQIAFAVNGIESDYYFLKIDELKYCFSQAAKGRYGTMYDRIDAAVIFEWIEKYLEERVEIVIAENIEKQKGYKNSEVPEVIANALWKIKDEINPEVIDKTIGPPVLREKTEQEKLIQSIFVEFDSLHKNKPYDPQESTRVIPYNGRNLSISEFVELRLEEIKKI